MQIQTWFCGSLGYQYAPNVHGLVFEWLLQLVSTSFAGEEGLVTMKTVKDVEAAADAWSATYLQVPESDFLPATAVHQYELHEPSYASAYCSSHCIWMPVAAQPYLMQVACFTGRSRAWNALQPVQVCARARGCCSAFSHILGLQNHAILLEAEVATML